MILITMLGSSLHGLNLFIKEVVGGVVHYDYLCTFGKSESCECPEGKSCSILLTPEDTSNYSIMEELVCGPILENPWISMPDTLPQINVIVGDCVPQPPSDNIGPGGGNDTGGDYGDHTGDHTGSGSSYCLDTTIYEKDISGHTIGLYFRKPSSSDRNLPVVLLVHGMGAQCTRWDNYFGRWFAQDGYRVAAVNLFPQNMDAPAEAWGWMFHPNGVQMNELIDTLHAYLERAYPGWNNKIIAVAHSRGGLEVEDVLYIRNNPYIDGVVTIGTPFYGTPIADMGVRLCENAVDAVVVCSPLLFTDYAIVYPFCVGAVELLEEFLCDAFPADMYILTEAAINNWRRHVGLRDSINSYPVVFDIGVGWTPEWKCGPFSGTNQAGCILMRYIARAGCNDGAVPLYSVRRRWVDNSSKTRIFSRWPSSYAPGCKGDPREWEKDHTQSVESHDIYQDVEERVRLLGSSSYIAALPEGPVPFSAPRSIPDDNPIIIYSRAFMKAVDSDVLNLGLLPGEDSILIWSPRSIEFYYTTVGDTQRLKGGHLYTVFTHSSTLSMRISRSEDADIEGMNYTPVFVVFADGDPLYVKLNKHIYAQNDPIYIKAHYSGLDTISGVFINTSMPTHRFYPVNFVSHGDTMVAVASLPEEGVYKLLVYAARTSTNGADISPRLAVATVVVVRDMDMDRVMGVLTGRYPETRDEKKDNSSSNRGGATILRDVLRVDYPEGSYTVYNVAGARVQSGRFKNYTVPLTGLKHGIFFVVVGGRIYKVVR